MRLKESLSERSWRNECHSTGTGPPDPPPGLLREPDSGVHRLGWYESSGEFIHSTDLQAPTRVYPVSLEGCLGLLLYNMSWEVVMMSQTQGPLGLGNQSFSLAPFNFIFHTAPRGIFLKNLITSSRFFRGFPGGSDSKESAFCVGPWVGKIPWRKAWQPTPVFLPGESHGQRNLAQRVRHDWATKRIPGSLMILCL